MEEVEQDLEALLAFVNDGAEKPDIDLTKLMGKVCDLLSGDSNALGITSGKYLALRGDPGELDDEDLLAAIKPHVPSDTYQQFKGASEDGILQDEYSDVFRDDSDDGYFEILEPIARAKGALEDMEYASSFVFIEYAGSGKTALVLAADYTWHSGDVTEAKLFSSVEAFEKEYSATFEMDGPHDFM